MTINAGTRDRKINRARENDRSRDTTRRGDSAPSTGKRGHHLSRHLSIPTGIGGPNLLQGFSFLLWTYVYIFLFFLLSTFLMHTHTHTVALCLRDLWAFGPTAGTPRSRNPYSGLMVGVGQWLSNKSPFCPRNCCH